MINELMNLVKSRAKKIFNEVFSNIWTIKLMTIVIGLFCNIVLQNKKLTRPKKEFFH